MHRTPRVPKRDMPFYIEVCERCGKEFTSNNNKVCWKCQGIQKLEKSCIGCSYGHISSHTLTFYCNNITCPKNVSEKEEIS